MTTNSQSQPPQVQPATSPPQADGPPNVGSEGVQERQYSETEYSQMQSKLRLEAQGIKNDREATALQADLYKAEALEAKAQLGVLQKELDNVYTEEDTKLVAQKIREAEVAIAKTEAQQRRLTGVEDANKAALNEANRVQYATTLSTRFGVGVDALLECQDPLEMLEIVGKQGTPSPAPPDSGVSDARPSDLSGKSPMELATMAYSPEETAKRKK